ncbi:DUF523 and DUF1722 domain-containing protein [candidate division WOR-3 bacterium]|nr:DUF523 and DUF1722 domain-containing protein [candidate division WOR-3 bacterium]
MGFPVPRVVFSRCLTFDNCRYNGQIIASEAVEQFRRVLDCVTPCPETDIGLGIPRDSIRMVKRGEGLRLVQPATGRDVTDEMRSWTRDFLDNLGPVDGFVLKGRSPSCGLFDVKLFGETSKGSALPGRIAGMFGAAVLERFPNLPIEDEGRLTNFSIREHFLTRVYVSARFRELAAKPAMAGLVKFQAENKLLLMAYNQARMRELGRVVANPDKLPVAEVFRRYAEVLPQAFAKQPRHTSAINVLQHAAGYFKDRVSAAEKRFFSSALASYRDGKVPLSVPQSIIRALVARFGEKYLEQQTFFTPYPEALQFISDSGKGRRTD